MKNFVELFNKAKSLNYKGLSVQQLYSKLDIDNNSLCYTTNIIQNALKTKIVGPITIVQEKEDCISQRELRKIGDALSL